MFTRPRGDTDFSYMLFVEGDTQCVTIQSSFRDNVPECIVKFDMDTEKVIWSEELPVIQDSAYLFSDELYYNISGENLIVVQNHIFILYDLYSGEQKNSVELEHYVEHLFQSGLDSYGVILSDGSFVAISIAINDLGEDVLIVEDVCSLGLDIDNLIYLEHVTYTSALINGCAVETNYDPSGNLVIASVNVHDFFHIEISKKIPLRDMLTPKQLQLTESFDSIWSADAVAIGNQYLAIGPLTDYCVWMKIILCLGKNVSI